tara:strand:- start:9223 stop:9744 length:522 start_codon:yes stop_codon:yes gene_type:complete
MIQIPYKHTLEWDYEGWRDSTNPSNPYTQKDWNQTLITKINQMSAIIFKASMRGGANRVRCNEKTLKILKTLEYFYENMEISGKYKIIVDDLILDNTFYVYSSRIHKTPFLFPIITENDNGDKGNPIFESPLGGVEYNLGAVSLKVETKSTKKECDEHRRSSVGKITILNYES